MEGAAAKHALASLIAEAFELQDTGSSSSSRPSASGGGGDDLLFEVQRAVEGAASADEGAALLRRMRRGSARSATPPHADALLARVHSDALRETLCGGLTSEEAARLEPCFRNARGAALALFDGVASTSTTADRVAAGAAFNADDVADYLDDATLDLLLLGDDDLAAFGLERAADAPDADQHGAATSSRPLDLMLGALHGSTAGEQHRYEGRLLPQRSPMKPSPPPKGGTASDDRGDSALPAEAARGPRLRIHRTGGKFLWACDVCGEENELADVVHAVRRRKVLRDGKLQTQRQQQLLLLEEGDEYLLKCRLCECRPSTK